MQFVLHIVLFLHSFNIIYSVLQLHIYDIINQSVFLIFVEYLPDDGRNM